MSEIYRKASIERLSSPEQLDQMIKLVSSKTWLVLVGGGIIILSVMFWGVYGRMPKMLQLGGILMSGLQLEGNGSGDMAVIGYVPLSEGKKLQKGMKVSVVPTNINEQEYGYIEGIVEQVGIYAATTEQMYSTLQNESLVTAFGQQGPVLEVRISLENDDYTASGLKWSNKKGRDLEVIDSTMVVLRVTLESKSPISKLFPVLQ